MSDKAATVGLAQLPGKRFGWNTSAPPVAAYLGVKPDTVYKWKRLKGMPHRKIGRLVKFQKDEIEKWVKSGKAAK
jgi:excisionase family DNA binding protein